MSTQLIPINDRPTLQCKFGGDHSCMVSHAGYLSFHVTIATSDREVFFREMGKTLVKVCETSLNRFVGTTGLLPSSTLTDQQRIWRQFSPMTVVEARLCASMMPRLEISDTDLPDQRGPKTTFHFSMGRLRNLTRLEDCEEYRLRLAYERTRFAHRAFFSAWGVKEEALEQFQLCRELTWS